MTTMTMRHYVICPAYCATASTSDGAVQLARSLDASECGHKHVPIDAADRDAAMVAFARTQRALSLVSTP